MIQAKYPQWHILKHHDANIFERLSRVFMYTPVHSAMMCHMTKNRQQEPIAIKYTEGSLSELPISVVRNVLRPEKYKNKQKIYNNYRLDDKLKVSMRLDHPGNCLVRRQIEGFYAI